MGKAVTILLLCYRQSPFVISSAVAGFCSLYSSLCEKGLVVSTNVHFIRFSLLLTVFTLFWINILTY